MPSAAATTPTIVTWLAFLAVTLSCAAAHGSPRARSAPHINPKCLADPAEIYSYHVHVVFQQTSERQTAEAKSLFSEFQTAFNLTHTPYCQGEAGDPWNNGSMALCLYPLALDIEGPFTSGQFAAFCPPATMEPVYRFFVQRRQDVSVLVHPNSGCETYDHSIWASWSGPVWPLNLDVFTCNSPGCVPPSW